MLNYASVSVVIPCYCCTLTLARAVNSVYSQLILPREVILVDDASPDSGKTRSLIEDLVLSFSRYQIAICPIFLSFNQGPGGARNAGWEVATQQFIAEPFLPVQKVSDTQSAKKADFIFEPDKEALIAELMPKILNTQLYKAVLDGNASEHGARMTAMDKASENANELLKSLKISYNRARQAAITTELTEIVSGAAALQG